MPTGYTADVQEGRVATVREFAIRCARGMGALILMRDEPFDAPVPKRLEPSTEYHDKAIAEAQKVLGELPALSVAECDTRAAAEFDAAMRRHTDYEAEKARQKNRYEEMIFRVERWKVPEELSSLREFMLDQLSKSLEFDCGGTYRPEPPVRLTGEKWREAQLAKASKDLSYHTIEREKEIDRTNGRNRWLDAFWAALPPSEPV